MRTKINVSGMSCHSCEQSLEKKIGSVAGVEKVVANSVRGQVTVRGSVELPSIHKVIIRAGFGVEEKPHGFFSRDRKVWKHLIYSAIIISGLLLIFREWAPGYSVPSLNSNSPFFLPILIGLAAGFSSCMAMVGGLVLGISARHAEKNPEGSASSDFMLQLYFNLGRVAGFFFLGGLLGLFGSVIRFSGTGIGIMTILVSVVMVVIGIQLTEIFPNIRLRLRFPFMRRLNFKNPAPEAFIAGVLTFFLPCGFTQAVQLYAMSTGNFVTGGVVMALFALGTTPALLGVGGVVSWFKKVQIKDFLFRFVGAIVVLFAIYNLLNGINLIGGQGLVKLSPRNATQEIDKNKWGKPLEADRTKAEIIEGKQTLRSVYDVESVLTPEDFVVKSGQTVRFEIFAKNDGEGCMGSILIPRLFDQYQLFEKEKTTVMEFVPEKPGRYLLVCAMGVPAGTLVVE